MHLVVITEARLTRGVDGQLRSPTEGRSYAFWSRYNQAGYPVVVVARVADSPVNEGQLVEGPGVTVAPLHDYRGFRGALLGLPRLAFEVYTLVRTYRHDAFILRVPGPIGSLFANVIRALRGQYALEVVGDPLDAIRGISSSMLGRLGARLAHAQLRRATRNAQAVAYVTERTLQVRYPAAPAALTTTYSSVDLPEEAYREPIPRPLNHPPSLVVVGNLGQPYKGHAVLLQAIQRITETPLQLRIVGDGRLRRSLECQALRGDHEVLFLGHLEVASQVREELDRADLFILPSLTEGLPRALLEAMARGLPCIATSVGGVPEVLPDEDLVPPADPDALANKIREVLADPARLATMGRRNYQIARRYQKAELDGRRLGFYKHVADAVATRSEDRIQ